MNPRRRMIRARRKLVKLTGTRQPREDLRKLAAFHSLENPEHVLRLASQKKAALEMRALHEKFPEIGRRVAKKKPVERIAIMKKLDALGRQRVENGLKRGFAMQELLNYSSGKELVAFLKRTTPERIKQLVALGFNEIQARNRCALIERHGIRKTTAFVEKAKAMGIKPENLDQKFCKEFYLTGTCDFEAIKAKQKEPKPTVVAEIENMIIIERPGKRRRFVDFRRHGKPLFSKSFRFSKQQQSALSRKGINAFNFSGKVRKVGSSNVLISASKRQAFYLEVPEISALIKEARPKRQHLRNVLAFADIRQFPAGEQLPGRIHVFELQSDIVAKLGPKNRERYKNWPELAILGIADFAAKNGFEEITISSPHLIKQVWPSLGKKLTQQIYYDLPKKMGFELYESRTKLPYIDSAFGQQQKGESGVFWFIRTKDLKKRFPEFFK